MKFESSIGKSKKDKTITLRMIESHEAAAVRATMTEVAASSPYILRTAEDFANMKIEEQVKWIDGHNESERDFLIGAFHEEKIIGLLGFRAFKNEKMKHRGSLGVSLRHEYRGEGVGEILFRRLFELAERIEGLIQIELNVMSENVRAFHLYKKMGFIETGRVPNGFVLSDGSFSDDIAMIKPI